MRVKVSEASDEDMDRVFAITSLAFQNHEPFWDITWPRHETELGRRNGANRFRDIKNSDQTTVYIKAVDEDTNVVVGMAKWHVFNNQFPDDSSVKGVDPDWDDEELMEYYRHMLNSFMEERYAAIKRTGGNLVSLDVLAVDPAYQRQGAGDALVKWGTTKADELGVEAVVESSPDGKRLYERNGFVFQKHVVVHVPEKWADREKQEFAWLVRPQVKM